jgi:hypothetical protein
MTDVSMVSIFRDGVSYSLIHSTIHLSLAVGNDSTVFKTFCVMHPKLHHRDHRTLHCTYPIQLASSVPINFPSDLLPSDFPCETFCSSPCTEPFSSLVVEQICLLLM